MNNHDDLKKKIYMIQEKTHLSHSWDKRVENIFKEIQKLIK